MPTAGRLAAAIAFAVFGWYISTVASPLFEEGQEPKSFVILCVLSGVWAGWVLCGSRAGRGYVTTIGNGFTAMAAMVFWIVFLMSFADMYKKSLRKLYDGPMEALVDVFSLMLGYGETFADQNLFIVLGVGTVLAAIFAEYFGRRFP